MGVKGLAVEESESWTVTQLITFVLWLGTQLKQKVMLETLWNEFNNEKIYTDIGRQIPSRVELPFIFLLRITVYGDNTDCRTGGVRDNDGLCEGGVV